MKLEYCSFQSLVSPFDVQRPIDWGQQFGRNAPLDVEIGFGMGEVLRCMAKESPERDFIGIEQHWERICKTLRAMKREQGQSERTFENIRVLKTDARTVFERLFFPKSIDTIYCLFPCPWPKKGHVKHRLFSREFLRLLNNRLKKGGHVKIVTDFYPYVEWVMSQIRWTGFSAETATIKPQYGTKFERKWKGEGQEEFFEVLLTKKRHVFAPVKKDKILKSYSLKSFDMTRLDLKDAKGSPTVIFKDVVYDKAKQKAMILALVAEEHMTQYFWINIVKKNNVWKIARADGQNFFPTPGIAKALALVHEAAKKAG